MQRRAFLGALGASLAVWSAMLAAADFERKPCSEYLLVLPVLVLGLGLLTLAYGVGLRVSRPVAWRVRKWLEPQDG